MGLTERPDYATSTCITVSKGVLSSSSPRRISSDLHTVNEDSLALILSYLDCTSAYTLSRLTSSRLRRDTSSAKMAHVWRDIMNRQGYCVEPQTMGHAVDTPVDFVELWKARRRLERVLMPSIRNGTSLTPPTIPTCEAQLQSIFHQTMCYNLPDSTFCILPVLPPIGELLEAYERDNDAPPVNFDCDSFVLTGVGTSPELAFLDPFTGALEIRNASVGKGTTTPPQTLLRLDDSSKLEARNYFANAGHDEMELGMCYVGIDTKAIWQPGLGRTQGSVVLVGRSLVRYRTSRSTQHSPFRAVELMAWFRTPSRAVYEDLHVCRFYGTFQAIDVDARYRRVYLSPSRRSLGSDEATHEVVETNTIHVYPLQRIEEREEQSNEENSYAATGPPCYPVPTFSIECREPVYELAVDVTGDFCVVGTVLGSLQIWKVPAQPTPACSVPSLQQMIPVSLATREAFPPHRRPYVVWNPSPVRDVSLPKHLPMHKFGMVTLQHGRNDGSNLLLWQYDAKKSWSIGSMIHLPLSSRRVPKIFYDGRRLVVLGQDYIGMVLLVYRVWNGRDEIAPDVLDLGVETAGGVYHLDGNNGKAKVQLVNRIRHVALGGLEYYDHVQLTCNERYLVMNTKMGNHLAPWGPTGANKVELGNDVCRYADGLLVIDLERAAPGDTAHVYN